MSTFSIDTASGDFRMHAVLHSRSSRIATVRSEGYYHLFFKVSYRVRRTLLGYREDLRRSGNSKEVYKGETNSYSPERKFCVFHLSVDVNSYLARSWLRSLRSMHLFSSSALVSVLNEDVLLGEGF